VVNALFLVELSAVIGAPSIGLSVMSKYTGIIGTEMKHNRRLINNIETIKIGLQCIHVSSYFVT